MSTKRIPPALQHKKDEGNKKALIWSMSIIGVLIVATIVLLLVT